MTSDRAVRQGMTNYAQRISFRTEKDADGVKHVVGYSLKMGVLQIEWACESNNWEDVEFTQLNNVRKLCTARILRALGSLRGQAKTDLPGAADYSDFVSRAQDLEESVITEWQEFTKVAIVRS
jgi:hypothetical protein